MTFRLLYTQSQIDFWLDDFDWVLLYFKHVISIQHSNLDNTNAYLKLKEKFIRKGNIIFLWHYKNQKTKNWSHEMTSEISFQSSLKRRSTSRHKRPGLLVIFLLIKFRFSKKATQIWKNLPIDLNFIKHTNLTKSSSLFEFHYNVKFEIKFYFFCW